MYPVAEDMSRLEYFADLPLSLYSDEDFIYIKKLLNDTRGLIAEGAEITLYSSCSYIVRSVETDCQKTYMSVMKSSETIENIRFIFYKLARKCLPRFICEYKTGDIEYYVTKRLYELYGSLVAKNHRFDVA